MSTSPVNRTLSRKGEDPGSIPGPWVFFFLLVINSSNFHRISEVDTVEEKYFQTVTKVSFVLIFLIEHCFRSFFPDSNSNLLTYEYYPSKQNIFT